MSMPELQSGVATTPGSPYGGRRRGKAAWIAAVLLLGGVAAAAGLWLRQSSARDETLGPSALGAAPHEPKPDAATTPAPTPAAPATSAHAPEKISLDEVTAEDESSDKSEPATSKGANAESTRPTGRRAGTGKKRKAKAIPNNPYEF